MTRRRKLASLIIAVTAVVAVFAWVRIQPIVRARDNLVPGMLFGPLTNGYGQHLELCMSNLNEAEIDVLVHFRNLTTGEVTTAQRVVIKSGTGSCVSYLGTGTVVGMARSETTPAEWVSPSAALIGTISVLNDRSTQASILGVEKLWLKGL